MLYPESERQTSWIALDPDCPVLCKEIQISYFSKPGEVVKTRNGRGFLNLLVTLVQDQQRVQDHQLKLARGSTCWTTSKELQTVSLCDILHIIPHRTSAGFIYLEWNFELLYTFYSKFQRHFKICSCHKLHLSPMWRGFAICFMGLRKLRQCRFFHSIPMYAVSGKKGDKSFTQTTGWS